MQNLNDEIQGVYETHLPVSDLDRAIAFYRDQLGLELASRNLERNVAFFWVGGKNQGMLGLWGAGSAPLHMVLHFAFRSTVSGVLESYRNLEKASIQPRGLRGEPVSEPVVIGWMPAVSVYFKDPDGHSIEVLAMLDDASDKTFGVGPYSAWVESRD